MQVSRLKAEGILKDSGNTMSRTGQAGTQKLASRDDATTRRLKTEKNLFNGFRCVVASLRE
jgi:hypothetical protein